MVMTAIGVSTQIWNNRMKSVMLLAGFPLLLLCMTWTFFLLVALFQPDIIRAWLHVEPVPAIGAAFAGLKHFWIPPLVIAGVWYFIAYFCYQPLLNMLTDASPILRKDQPKLYNLLENLCISRGITMPTLYIANTDALNAFASGLAPGSISITVTAGLLNSLTDQEMEAVLAHELTHVINKDVQLVLIGTIFAGMLTLICDLLYQMLRFNIVPRDNDREERSAGGLMLIGFVVFLIGRVFAFIIRMTISREREYMADAGSVELTKNPDALISALRKISTHSYMGGMAGEISQMCIEDANDDTFDWFSTHPSIDARVKALEVMGGHEMRADEPPPPSAPPSPPTQHGPWG
jgi:heat shock protein HtpX